VRVMATRRPFSEGGSGSDRRIGKARAQEQNLASGLMRLRGDPPFRIVAPFPQNRESPRSGRPA
jgi:hypothetical protein